MKSLKINQLGIAELKNAALYFDECFEELIALYLFFEDKTDIFPFKSLSECRYIDKYNNFQNIDFEVFKIIPNRLLN